MFRPSRLILGLCVFVFNGLANGAEIEILKVDFSLVDVAGGDPWYEISIAISIERGDEGPSVNPRFADDIKVSLALATQSDRSSRSVYDFYSATADYPTLEVGRHTARFYLLPELVKRDRVRGEPYAFEIFVSQDEENLAQLRSRNLEQQARLEAFRAKLDDSDSGILRPQAESPFSSSYLRDTPTSRMRTY